MIKKLLIVYLGIVFLLLISGSLTAFPFNGQYSISSHDNVLIVAPHPDDEILACGGIIQQALREKANVYVLYVTDGEHNLLSLLYYRKTFLVKNRKEYIDLGEIRKKESIDACKSLGLARKNLIFLDYPDSGILKIFLKHWAKTPPFKDSLSKADHVEKGEGISPLAPYKGESLLGDIEQVFKKVKPTRIFLPSPFDDNQDHVGTYLFCKLALLDLRDKMSMPEEFLYLVHRNKISLIERYSTRWYKKLSDYFDKEYSDAVVEFPLEQDMLNKKREAIGKFKSQMYCKKFLYSFADDNKELFFLSQPPLELTSGNKNYSFAGYILDRKKNTIGKVSLKLTDKTIFISINILGAKEMERGNIFVLGYKKEALFSSLPKIRIGIHRNKYAFYEKGKKIPFRKLKRGICRISKDNIEVKVPLQLLGEPEEIFLYLNGALLNDTFLFPWRIIALSL